MNNYKMIFSDIDGTILDSNHKVSNKTKEVVKKLEGKKVPFVLVSARMPKGIRTVIKELEINSPIVAYSGALVQDKEGVAISQHSIKRREAVEIAGYIRKEFPDVSISMYSNDYWLTDDVKNPWIVEEEKITAVKSEAVGSFREVKSKKIHKLLCMGNKSEIEALESSLVGRFAGIKVYKSKDTYLEIMNFKASKSKAMKILGDIYHISMKDTIAFGDNYNDIDMLQSAGLGVAMGNAPEDVKKAADIIALSNDEDGVFHVIDKIKIIV